MLPYIFLTTLLGSIAVTAFPTPRAPLRIPTMSGTLQGHIKDSAPHVRQFLGVPYALPPTGPLRWKPPTKANATSTRAPRNATSIGPACPQLPLRNAWVYSVNGDNMTESFTIEDDYAEDCLTLNVWTPLLQHHASPSRTQNATTHPIDPSGLPVIVWFFGGGFVQGGTNSRYFNPTSWIEISQSHIVVTVNFRSNVFGFPNVAGLEQQNLGLLDQRLALEWVRENIARFGGDESRIAAWGESSGAIAVDWLGFAFPQDPIMGAMILDSATALFPAEASVSSDPVYANFSSVAEAVGCGGVPASSDLPTAEMLDCMRGVSWETIEGVITSDKMLHFLPVVDENLVFSNYTQRYETGAWPAIPAIIGTTQHELNTLIPHVPNTPPSQEEFYDKASNASFLCASAAATSSLRNVGDRAATTYMFIYDGDFVNMSPSDYPDAYHATELPMVFGTMGDLHGPSTAYEKRVSREMQDLWLEFARDPEGGLRRVGWGSYADGKAVVLGRNDELMVEINLDQLEGVCSK